MKRIINQIPNVITTLNLLSGALGVIMVFNGEPIYAVLLMAAAAVFDFLDGMSARLLKAYSEIGKQLDSLADLISFGFLPGIMVYKIFLGQTDGFLIYTGLLIPAFSAYRLAKFNIDTRQTKNFIGLPTPANAILFASIFLIINVRGDSELLRVLQDVFSSLYVLTGLVLASSYLLISEHSMFSLKFENLSLAENWYRFLLLGISVALLLIISYMAFPFIILFYVILSFVLGRVNK